MEKLALRNMGERNARNKKQEAQSSNRYRHCYCVQRTREEEKQERGMRTETGKFMSLNCCYYCHHGDGGENMAGDVLLGVHV
mmetsp:Transcript_16234/g.21780  ORF Transcript_16234/g.21780 Transcript_16234/m.21780 type:complete len:82 (+) Transcript_16234:456-701(+)